MPRVLSVVLAHDERALKISQAQRLKHGMVCAYSAFTPALLDPLLHEVGANDSFIVVHVFGGTDAGADVVERLQSCFDTIRMAVPGARTLRQWVLQLAGPTWDTEERDLVLRAQAAAAKTRMGGALVVARSSVAYLGQSEDEELITGRDVLHCLVHSPELQRQLAEFPRVLFVGTTSVTFDRAEGVAAAAERRARVVVAQLLAPARSEADHAVGGRDVEALGLASEEEGAQLLRGPEGGSVLAPLRVSQLVHKRLFDDKPVGDWPGLVGAALEELQCLRVRAAVAAVERNADVRESQIAAELERAILRQFRESANVQETEHYVEGLVEGLNAVRAELISERGATFPTSSTDAQARLLRFATHFPQPAALTLRFLLLATLVVLASTGPLPKLLAWSDDRVRLVARTGAAITVALGMLLLQSRWRRLVRARDGALRAGEEAALSAVERAVLDARIDLLGALVRWLTTGDDSWLGRLSTLRTGLEGHAPKDGGDSLVGLRSRMAVALTSKPLGDGGDDQSDADRETLADLLTQNDLKLPSGADALDWLAQALPPSSTALPTGLAEALRTSSTGRDEARRVLSLDAVPVIGDVIPELQTGEVRRYLCVTGGSDGTIAGLLDLSRLGVDVDAVLDIDDVEFVGLFHTRDADLTDPRQAVTQ